MTMFSALDIVSIGNKYGFPLERIARLYFMLSSALEIGWLRAQIMMQAVEDQWESLAKAAFRDELDGQQREITINVLKQYPDITDIEQCVNDLVKETPRGCGSLACNAECLRKQQRWE